MALRARQITFAYPPHRREAVLRSVCVDIPPGVVTAIVGPNASGKSTFVRLLAGLLTPTTGEVSCDGLEGPVHRAPPRERARRIALIAQRPTAAFGHTLADVVAFGAFAAGGAAGTRDGNPLHALNQVGLADRANDPFETLSAGQQQRGALARALLQLGPDPTSRVLLADEPTSAQDPAEVERVASILRALASRGTAVGVVLHDLTLAARLADRALLLSNSGEPVAEGGAADILTPDRLAGVFGVGFERVEGAGGPAILRAGASPLRYPEC